MEANLLRMAAFFQNGPSRLRPHYKNHKCVALAKRQLAAGAIGITCATIREAETLVKQGVDHVLIANEIAGWPKIERLANLVSQADVIIAVDHIQTVRAFAIAQIRRGVPISVLVDVDVGLGRCGVRPGQDVLRLVQQILQEGLRFRGLMGYEGRLTYRPGLQKQAICKTAMEKLIECRQLLEAHGIPVEIVSAGGTSSYSIAGQYPGITEIQAGSYIVMDREYSSICAEFEPVLTVLATVISKTGQERVVIDAGFKSISADHGLPTLKNAPDMRLRKLNAEHGVIDILDSSRSIEIGSQIELWVQYADATVNLHKTMWGIRGEEVEEVFRIEG